MSRNQNESELISLAGQLSCPAGEYGLKVAENMAANNRGMIKAAIDALSLGSGETLLEIGPGAAGHLDLLMEQAEELEYYGVDISALMIAEATRQNSSLVGTGRASFILSDGEQLPFDENKFDKIFSVNTLYFWKKPLEYAREIQRVLKPYGTFCLCFAPKEFMEKLPFTAYVFNLYTIEEAQTILKEAGFTVSGSNRYMESVHIGEENVIEREFVVLSASTSLRKHA